MSKEMAQYLLNEIHAYRHLASAVQDTTYCWILTERRDLIAAANEIVDLIEEEIQRKKELLEDTLESAGLTMGDLCDDEDAFIPM